MVETCRIRQIGHVELQLGALYPMPMQSNWPKTWAQTSQIFGIVRKGAHYVRWPELSLYLMIQRIPFHICRMFKIFNPIEFNPHYRIHLQMKSWPLGLLKKPAISRICYFVIGPYSTSFMNSKSAKVSMNSTTSPHWPLIYYWLGAPESCVLNIHSKLCDYWMIYRKNLGEMIIFYRHFQCLKDLLRILNQVD